jgi:hypothetical protein
MSNQDEDLLASHDEDRPAPAWRMPTSPLALTPDGASKIASEMHRWGRMTGVFSIILMVIWLVVGTFPAARSGGPGVTIIPAPDPGVAAIRSSLLWPGVALAIIAVSGLLAGFGLDYRAGHKR